MPDQLVATASCPQCQGTFELRRQVGRAGPVRAGDVSVCSYCAGINEYGPDLVLRPADPEVLARLRWFDPESARAIDSVVGILRQGIARRDRRAN